MSDEQANPPLVARLDHPLVGVSCVRLEDGATTYATIGLRLCTVDSVAWDRVDWDRLVAPRFTRIERPVRATVREARQRVALAWDALRHG